MCFNQAGDISTLDGTSLKLVDKFTYLGSSVSSTEKDIDTRLTKTWTAIDKLSVIWKSNLTDKMKHSFFQAAVVSILRYGCTTWTFVWHWMTCYSWYAIKQNIHPLIHHPKYCNCTRPTIKNMIPDVLEVIIMLRKFAENNWFIPRISLNQVTCNLNFKGTSFRSDWTLPWS